MTDLLLFGDGGLPLLQHGQKLRDLQLETLLCGRLGAADLRLDRGDLGLMARQRRGTNIGQVKYTTDLLPVSNLSCVEQDHCLYSVVSDKL